MISVAFVKRGNAIIELVWVDISSGPLLSPVLLFHLHISASLHE